MDHVVYLDFKSKELESLLSNSKSMLIRGATGRKLPHGRVNIGDVLYFINNNGEGKVRAKAIVSSTFHSDKLEKEESVKLIQENQDKLKLTDKQFNKWVGKRYIVLVGVSNITVVEPFEIDKSSFQNMDDWLLVENIEKVIHIHTQTV